MLLLGCLLVCQQNLHAQLAGNVLVPTATATFQAIPVAYRTSSSDLSTSEVVAEYAVQGPLESPTPILQTPQEVKHPLPADQPVVAISSDPIHLASLAAHRSAAARLLRKQAAAGQSSSGRHDEIEAYYVYRCFVLLQADHQSQRSAAQALEAYYGYAALQAASQIQRELIAEIDELRLTLANLIDKGISVGDTTQLDRARIQASDALIQSEYGMQRIHSQLSLLVGSEVGCQLQVDHLQPPSIPTDNVCDLIEQAYCNRRDFAAWDFLSRKLNVDNLPGLRDVVGSTALVPAFPSSLSSRWVDKLVPGRLAKLESELCERQKQLAEIKQALRKQIAVEVEVAWLDHSAAYQRWELAGQNVASWQERIEQLDRAVELGKAFPEDRITAKLEVKRAELERIQRWNDVQQAHVRLRQAIGDLPTR